MITRIEIDGFKSFRNFHLDLEPFQVIVGLNAAGKSNLMDAFRFISRVVTSEVTTAYQEMWAATGELFTVLPDRTLSERMSFALEFLVENLNIERTLSEYLRLRYELSIRRAENGSELTIEREQLVEIPQGGDKWLSSKTLSGVASRVWYTNRSWDYLSGLLRVELKDGTWTDLDVGKLIDKSSDFAKSASTLGRYAAIMMPVRAVHADLRRLSFLQMEPEAVRTSTSARGPSRLDETGKYLPNLLARIAKQEESLLTDVGSDLSNLVTGLIRLEVEEDKAQGHNNVWVYTPEGKRFSLRELSDGTLRLLVLAALRNDPDQQGTLLLEEPETGVHPFRIKQIVSLLRSMATDFTQPLTEGEHLRQVIATTHSPVLVSQLEDHEILFAHMVDVTVEGQPSPMRVTRISSLKQPDSPALQAFTKRELLRYLDRKDLESRSKGLKGGTP